MQSAEEEETVDGIRIPEKAYAPLDNHTKRRQCTVYKILDVLPMQK
jgi:hypothetical protein